MMRVEISDQSGQQFLDRVTRTQLERALMRAAPPTNVATEASKEQTRKAMDLRALMQERVQMQRLGFGDAVHKLDEEIERRRALQAREKAAFEEKLLANRLRALEMMHHRRDQELRERELGEEDVARARHERALDEMIERHEKEYNRLVEESALRATGGVETRDDSDERWHLSRKNKCASFNTRRPTREVVKLRQNAARLARLGREAEANEMSVRAAALDERAEQAWRGGVIYSAMGTDRSRLQMQLRRQEVEVHAIEEEYASRMHRMQREHKRRRFNQKRTQMAEKVKVHKKVRVQVQRKYDPSVIALQEHQAKLRQRLAEKMLARDDGKSAFSFASRAKGDCYDHSVKDEDYSWRAPDALSPRLHHLRV